MKKYAENMIELYARLVEYLVDYLAISRITRIPSEAASVKPRSRETRPISVIQIAFRQTAIYS